MLINNLTARDWNFLADFNVGLSGFCLEAAKLGIGNPLFWQVAFPLLLVFAAFFIIKGWRMNKQ